VGGEHLKRERRASRGGARSAKEVADFLEAAGDRRGIAEAVLAVADQTIATPGDPLAEAARDLRDTLLVLRGDKLDKLLDAMLNGSEPVRREIERLRTLAPSF
jgi:hypothetical protein